MKPTSLIIILLLLDISVGAAFIGYSGLRPPTQVNNQTFWESFNNGTIIQTVNNQNSTSYFFGIYNINHWHIYTVVDTYNATGWGPAGRVTYNDTGSCYLVLNHFGSCPVP